MLIFGGGKKPIGVYLAMFLRGIFILLHGQMGAVCAVDYGCSVNR